MQLRKSFVLRIFLILLVVFLLLFTISSIGIYSFSRQVVGEEYIRLNRTSLSFLASSASCTLNEIRNFGKKLAVNSRILELSSDEGRDAAREARDILVSELSEFNATHLDGAALVEAYVITQDGMNISAYNSGRFTWETIQQNPALQPLLSGEVDALLLPTATNEGVYGIMGHTLQIAISMRDLFSNTFRGIVLLDISEIALYDQFRQFQDDNITIQVVTDEGEILSAKSKREIGTVMDYTVSDLAQKDINSQISGDFFLIYESIPNTEWFVVMQMPARMAFGTLTMVRNMVFGLFASCAVAAVVVLMFLARRITGRIDGIREKMGEVVAGDLSVRIPVTNDDEFGEIESAFNSMVEEIRCLIEKVRQEEQQRHIAQMDFLHAQINSHFIHNTLTSIRFMLEMDQVQEAGEMIYYFSRLLRQTLSRSTEFVPLREELDTLKSYVMLQSYRYKNTFQATFDLAEDTLSASVPVLILQPIVENAIFHGGREHPIHICIRSFREGENLIVTVEDDGLGIPREKLECILQKDASMNRVGLHNVHERIQLIYGMDYGLTIRSQPGQGTVVRFTLPIHQEGEDEHEA